MCYFFDSSFILAIFNVNDENHKKVKKLLESTPSLFNQKKVINNIVLIEVLNKLKKSYYKPVT
ncbi:MAG: PIN domain-containing protein [Methanosphaera stadtmanae]|nr:PIN domain-containing protein [Methanosphaera stadtmanae]